MSEIYEKLRERLDMFPQGFPRTESRVELEILRELFSPDEAEIMLFLRPAPEPASAVAERMGRDEAELAKQILAKAEEDGLVQHSSNHLGKKIFICNCCGCCCKALAHITKRHNPDAIARSNYYAVVDQDECNACEVCIDRCQVDAIRLEDDVAAVDLEACIGCGLCVPACPTEGISLARKQADAASPIFADDAELLQTVARDKNKEYPFQ